MKMPDKLIMWEERKEALSKRIREAEKYNQNVIDSVQKILSQYTERKISLEEYQEKLEELLQGRPTQLWIDYYDDYIVQCKKEIEICDKGIRRGKIKEVAKKSVPYAIIFGVLFILLFAFFVLKEKEVFLGPLQMDSYSQTLDFVTSESTVYKWTPENLGRLQSVKISGQIEGSGDVRIYLVDGEREFLILDSDNLEFEEISLSSGIINIREFTEICQESCELPSLELNDGVYDLRIEITGTDSVSLNLNEITYEVLAELTETPPEVIGEQDYSTSEQEFAEGKRVIVTSFRSEDLVNVLMSAEIQEVVKFGDKERIKIRWIEENRNIDFNAIDSDNDGFIDRVQWLVPNLKGKSDQTFEIIIEITKAEHLSPERKFISDIFEEVRELDGIWSETIPDGDYVRVTFERPLTNDKDITIYPRTISGSPRIEVYEVDGNELIAVFESLNNNEYNTILLTNLQGSQDTFDLRIINGDVQFDHIVDPPPGQILVEITSTSADTIATGTYTLLNDMTAIVSIDGIGSHVLFHGQASFSSTSGNADCFLGLFIDGAMVAEGHDYVDTADTEEGSVGLSWWETGLSAGSHTFELRWKEDQVGCIASTDEQRSMQVIEFTSSDVAAEILSEITSISEDTAQTTSYTVINDMITSPTIAGTDSVVFIEGIVTFDCGTSDCNSWMGLFIDDTLVAEGQTGMDDLTIEPGVVRVTWWETGLSAGSHTFDLRWKEDSSTGVAIMAIDTQRSLQVVEFTGANVPTILSEITSTSTDTTANGSYTIINDMNDTVTIDGPESLVIVSASITFDNDASDSSAFAAIFIDGVMVAEQENFIDDSDQEPGFIGLMWVDTGLSAGDHNFSIRFKEVGNAGIIMATDTQRHMQVVEFEPIVDIGVCQVLSAANTVYRLTGDILNQAGNCFTITADNITFEGQGFVVDGTDSSVFYGFQATGIVNFTIMNLTISDFNVPINFQDGVNDSTIFNVNFTSSGQSTLSTSHNNQIINNSIVSGGGAGFLFQPSSRNNTIRGNSINGTTSAVFFSTDSDNNTVADNVFTQNDFGVRTAFAESNIIQNNTAYNNSFDGVFIGTLSNYNLIQGNLIYNNSRNGVFISTASNITIRDNIIIGNADKGIRLSGSGTVQNKIINNTITNNSLGIVLETNVKDNFLLNNNIFNNVNEEIDDNSGNLQLNFLIYNNSFGEIKWTDTTNFVGFIRDLTVEGDLTFPGNITISNNLTQFNTEAFGLNPGINSTANITFYGSPGAGFGAPEILKNGELCGPVCHNFTALTAAEVVFNVTGFTNYSLGDGESISPPVILDISDLGTLDIIPGDVVYITFNVTVSDLNGVADISNVNASFSRGGVTRYNSSCVPVDLGLTLANYSCTIDLWYFDEPGLWNVNAIANDTGNLQSADFFETFILSETIAVSHPSNLSWPTLLPGDENILSDIVLLLNNTGNANISVGNVNVTGINLLGLDDSSFIINASNFTVSTFPSCDIGPVMVNGTSISITGANLSRGNNSLNLLNEDSGQEQLFVCLEQVPATLPPQEYSASGDTVWELTIFIEVIIAAWLTTIFAAPIAIARKRKKKKPTKLPDLLDFKDLDKADLQELITILEKEYRDKYGIELQELLVNFRKTKIDNKLKLIKIPTIIFKQGISPAEALSKYLKENKGMKFSEIAKLLNRDERTIWINYRNASKKKKEKIVFDKEKDKLISVPVSIFRDRRLSILESLVLYFREKGFSNPDIANVLGKGSNNIWTLYLRAMRKLKS